MMIQYLFVKMGDFPNFLNKKENIDTSQTSLAQQNCRVW